jgi:predicted regulator of Ras-like GTPase activity (Roadblock/LC7/MglB family)
MENLEETVNKIVKQENDVIGLVCADLNGLCIKKHGEDISGTISGYMTNIARKAETLVGWHGDENSTRPIILIETDQKRILIQRQGPITVGLYKKYLPTHQE